MSVVDVLVGLRPGKKWRGKENLALCSVTPSGKDPVAKFKSEVSEITTTDAKVEGKCF